MSELPKLVVANFKKTGTAETIEPFITAIGPLAQGLLGLAHIVICPPDPYLEKANFFISKYGYSDYMSVGVQNFDSVDDSNKKQTSQTTAEMVADFAQYVILGHSEVREWNQNQERYLGDTPEEINIKIKLAQEANLTPIVCVSDIGGELEALKKAHPDFGGVIAYEPLGSVGTGSVTKPEDADKKAQEILHLFPSARVLYGGSVTGDRAREFFSQPHLSGVLVGNNSSGPEFFKKILQAFPMTAVESQR